MNLKLHFTLRSFAIIVLSFFFRSGLQASVDIQCDTPREANDILKCLQQKHPEIQSEAIINEVSEKLAAQGSAWKNPQVSVESIQGDNLGSKVVESEARLSQTIEVTGQRSARRNRGKALGLSFKAESLGKLEDVTVAGIKSLYRLTQLMSEIEAVEESVKRFRIIKNQYQARPRLNPDQEVTLGIIQLAVSEYEIKLSQLTSERKEILSELSASTGLSAEMIEKNIPPVKTEWPEAPKLSGEINSSVLLKAQSQVDLSLSDFEEAKSMAWPEFTVSLIAQDRIDGSFQYQMIGAGISAPLPLFQRNQGEKILASNAYVKAKKIQATTLKKVESHSQNLKQIYQNSVLNLKNTPSNKSIEIKHKKTEALFSQGLISGPIFIEAHKQRVEYLESRNEQELQALEALWSLYILDGTFLSKKL